jgi:hypothetical protein
VNKNWPMRSRARLPGSLLGKFCLVLKKISIGICVRTKMNLLLLFTQLKNRSIAWEGGAALGSNSQQDEPFSISILPGSELASGPGYSKDTPFYSQPSYVNTTDLGLRFTDQVRKCAHL